MPGLRKNWIPHFLLLLLLTTLIAGALSLNTPSTQARPEYAKDLPRSLKNYCQVCHAQASGGSLNLFGVDYAAANRNITMTRTEDSDGDGYSNGEELAAGTFPGDPNSYPGGSAPLIKVETVVAIVGVSSPFIFIGWYIFNKIREPKKKIPARDEDAKGELDPYE